MSERVVEALQELVASEGWTIFKAMAMELYGDEAVVGELMRKANSTLRLEELGMQTAVVLGTQTALRNLLSLPDERLKEIEAANQAGDQS